MVTSTGVIHIRTGSVIQAGSKNITRIFGNVAKKTNKRSIGAGFRSIKGINWGSTIDAGADIQLVVSVSKERVLVFDRFHHGREMKFFSPKAFNIKSNV